MIRQTFNADWTAGPAVTGFANLSGALPVTKVTLPHDAVRDLVRSPDAPDGPNNGYFPGGYFRYTKTFEVPDSYREKVVIVEFEGVYRDAVVYVNGEFAAQRPSGYSAFSVDLTPFLRYGQTNTIVVEARAHLDSRWYTGAGIYRDTHLIIADPVHVALDGVRISTPDIDDERAVVTVDVTVQNEDRSTRTLRVVVALKDPDGRTVSTGTVPLTLLPTSTGTARLRLYLLAPLLWDVESPHLYAAHTTVSEMPTSSSGGVDEVAALDEEHTSFGVRRLQLDPMSGLRINGRTVKLRGACIHHDNGLLGSATIARAEERRIEILKDAGFNAVRSSHNSLSRASLQACDRLGMLVMDETFDVWTEPKSSFDYSLSFPEWWERDVEAMVAKDFNHPSVIFYSIGNEIFENGSGPGSIWGRRLAEKVRRLDDTRFVTNAVNGFVAVMEDLPSFLGGEEGTPSDVNSLIAAMGEMMNQVAASPMVSARTEEAHGALDVSGLNYADARYVSDRTDYPNRVIVGTETFPAHIDVLWPLVVENSHVLGDFTWTGWDYLGEAGVGRFEHPEGETTSTSIFAPFPALTAGCGDIDITGHRRPVSYYRETVFGLRQTPYIAVHRPQFHGRRTILTPWSWPDVIASWSFEAAAGSPVTIDVYSDADEVELILNGTPVSRVEVGLEKACLARFETTYHPGELVAVAYQNQTETGRSTLHTATGDLRLSVVADRSQVRADTADLVYLTIELHDADANIASHRDRVVEVDVSGPAVLAGLGTGRTCTEDRFDAPNCPTLDGRALAILRPTGAGEVQIHVRAAECTPVAVSVQIEHG